MLFQQVASAITILTTCIRRLQLIPADLVLLFLLLLLLVPLAVVAFVLVVVVVALILVPVLALAALVLPEAFAFVLLVPARVFELFARVHVLLALILLFHTGQLVVRLLLVVVEGVAAGGRHLVQHQLQGVV